MAGLVLNRKFVLPLKLSDYRKFWLTNAPLRQAANVSSKLSPTPNKKNYNLMYFCYYQKKIDLNYLLHKIKFGSKPVIEFNDIQKSNLKGSIKSYKLTSIKKDNKVVELIEFNMQGNFVKRFFEDKTKFYKYYKNDKISSCETFNKDNALILTEKYRYDDKWSLISKEVFNEERNEYEYNEFYEYDLRKNITAIIQQHKIDDDIQTLKYDKNGNLIARYNFVNKTYVGREMMKVEHKIGGSSKRVTRFTSENDILFDVNSIVNSKNDVITELSYNFLALKLKNINSTITITYNYHYDNYGNWILRTKHVDGEMMEELAAEINYH